MAHPLAVALTALLLVTLPGNVLAQKSKKSPKQDEKRENEAVREAERSVDDAQKQLKGAQSAARDAAAAWRRALQGQKSAAANLQQVRARLEQKHEASTGLESAREQLRKFTAELSRVSAPIIEGVQQAHPQLIAELARWNEQLKREDDPAQRREAARQIPSLTSQLRDLERAAIAEHAEASRLQEQVDAQMQRVQNAVAKFEAAVERDTEFRDANAAWRAADREADQAEQAAAKAARAADDAKSDLAKATAELQRKRLQDARDANRKPQAKKPEK